MEASNPTYALLNNTKAGVVVSLYWPTQTPLPASPNQSQVDVLNVINLGSTANAGTLSLPNKALGAPGYSFKLINSLPIANTLKVKDSDTNVILLSLPTISFPNDYIFTLITTSATTLAWEIESIPAQTSSDIDNYLIDVSTFTFTGALNSVNLEWATQSTTGSEAIKAARTVIINGVSNDNTHTNTIVLPNPALLPLDLVGSAIITLAFVPDSTVTTNYTYVLQDFDNNTLGTYIFAATSYKGGRIITCVPINNSSSATLTWAVSVTS